MRVLFSFWGVLAKKEDQSLIETPDGLRGERAFFVDELLKRGHDVIQAQCTQDPKQYCYDNGLMRRSTTVDSTGYPDVDVVFVEWRWKRLGKSFEDWERQCALLDHYTRIGTPIIVQDTDLKITEEDERRWPAMIIGDPCLKPKRLFQTRIHMPFCNVFEKSLVHSDPAGYVYVGNNYERQTQFERYYAEPARQLRQLGIQTTVYGNWLTKSPERMNPRAVIQQYPHVSFSPRVAYRDVLHTLHKSLAVCHISKEEYSAHGNVTVRYFESIAAGVPALIPSDSVTMRSVGDSVGLTVATSDDVVAKLKILADVSQDTRTDIVATQKHALCQLTDFSPAHKVDVIEAIASYDIRRSDL